MIHYERDYDFDFFGFATLERSYLLKHNNKILERPQHLFMKVAIGLFVNVLEDKKYLKDIEETTI